MNTLLDTSALLAFLLDEPEADAVQDHIFSDTQEAPACAVSFATWVETYARLKHLGLPEREIRAQLDDARALPITTLWPDEPVLAAMLQIRASGYFPFADTLIAATAIAYNLTLVHKDKHFTDLSLAINQRHL